MSSPTSPDGPTSPTMGSKLPDPHQVARERAAQALGPGLWALGQARRQCTEPAKRPILQAVESHLRVAGWMLVTAARSPRHAGALNLEACDLMALACQILRCWTSAPDEPAVVDASESGHDVELNVTGLPGPGALLDQGDVLSTLREIVGSLVARP